MMPQPQLIQAFGIIMPRIMKSREDPKLTKDLIPENSILREMFDEEEDEEIRTEVCVLYTPFGDVKIKSMSKNS
jgi:hypothetical protein